MKRITGIYCFINRLNGKRYVGQSTDVYKRKYTHETNATRYGIKSPFYDAIRKYGVTGFDFVILEVCPRDRLLEQEIYWIQQLGTYKLEYNMSLGGESSPASNPEVAAKISASHKGRKKTPEHLEKIGASRRGVKQSPEAIAARAKALTGRKLSEEHKKRISEAHFARSAKKKGLDVSGL